MEGEGLRGASCCSFQILCVFLLGSRGISKDGDLVCDSALCLVSSEKGKAKFQAVHVKSFSCPMQPADRRT